MGNSASALLTSTISPPPHADMTFSVPVPTLTTGGGLIPLLSVTNTFAGSPAIGSTAVGRDANLLNGTLVALSSAPSVPLPLSRSTSKEHSVHSNVRFEDGVFAPRQHPKIEQIGRFRSTEQFGRHPEGIFGHVYNRGIFTVHDYIVDSEVPISEITESSLRIQANHARPKHDVEVFLPTSEQILRQEQVLKVTPDNIKDTGAQPAANFVGGKRIGTNSTIVAPEPLSRNNTIPKESMGVQFQTTTYADVAAGALMPSTCISSASAVITNTALNVSNSTTGDSHGYSSEKRYPANTRSSNPSPALGASSSVEDKLPSKAEPERVVKTVASLHAQEVFKKKTLIILNYTIACVFSFHIGFLFLRLNYLCRFCKRVIVVMHDLRLFTFLLFFSLPLTPCLLLSFSFSGNET